MAKSDSFFIRAIVSTDTTNFAQTSIDLGAYVDALGKSVPALLDLTTRAPSNLLLNPKPLWST